jgi:ferredoxin
VLAKVGAKLLDIAEASQVPMESGCRMGMCGSDPVRILEGEENLSAMRSAERRTLERLSLGAGCRMACVSRVQGPVVVDPKPALATSESEDDEPQRLLISADDAFAADDPSGRRGRRGRRRCHCGGGTSTGAA